MINDALRRSIAYLCGLLGMALCCLPSEAQGDTEALEQQNLEKAVRCMEILEIELDVDLFGDECVADGHTEHSPRVPDGKEGLLVAVQRP